MPNNYYPAPPAGWLGSTPEWAVYWALTKLGYKPDQDFTYQSAEMGGRLALGGVVLDFLIHSLNLAINVHSIYWHYQPSAKQHDAMARAMMEGQGIQMIYIEEEDCLRDPLYYVKEALKGVDHSRIGER